MRLDPPEPRDRGEPVAPMINVVFLLLIFFMMAATLAPPDPIETVPPVSSSPDEAEASETLFVGADGTLAYGPLRGEAVFAALKGAETLSVKADARAEARTLAQALARLREAGVATMRLTVEAR